MTGMDLFLPDSSVEVVHPQELEGLMVASPVTSHHPMQGWEGADVPRGVMMVLPVLVFSFGTSLPTFPPKIYKWHLVGLAKSGIFTSPVISILNSPRDLPSLNMPRQKWPGRHVMRWIGF